MKPDKQRVLIVDGHGDLTVMAPLFFETRSCEVVIANERAEGFTLAMGGSFDLYILDITLIDGSGVELARRIRAFAPEALLVFYSARAFPAEARESIERGADAYFTQQCDPMELYERVKKFIRVK
jgi:DNA-binding response OmpR family regulator